MKNRCKNVSFNYQGLRVMSCVCIKSRLMMANKINIFVSFAHDLILMVAVVSE